MSDLKTRDRERERSWGKKRERCSNSAETRFEYGDTRERRTNFAKHERDERD